MTAQLYQPHGKRLCLKTERDVFWTPLKKLEHLRWVRPTYWSDHLWDRYWSFIKIRPAPWWLFHWLNVHFRTEAAPSDFSAVSNHMIHSASHLQRNSNFLLMTAGGDSSPSLITPQSGSICSFKRHSLLEISFYWSLRKNGLKISCQSQN